MKKQSGTSQGKELHQLETSGVKKQSASTPVPRGRKRKAVQPSSRKSTARSIEGDCLSDITKYLFGEIEESED